MSREIPVRQLSLEAAEKNRVQRIVEYLKEYPVSDADTQETIAWDCFNLLYGDEQEALMKCYEEGPLYDGDWPSKEARDSLFGFGLIEPVIVSGEDGYWAVVNPGNDLCKVAKETRNKDD